MDSLKLYPILASLLKPFRLSQQKTCASIVVALCQCVQASSFAIAGQLSESRHAPGAHPPKEATIEFIYPTDSTQELAQHAQEALERIFREGYEYRKAGVELNGLVPAGELTGRLFDNEMLERFGKVMPIVDMLNRKYGRDTVRLARANPRGRWRTKFEYSSPHYTTRLSEVQLIH